VARVRLFSALREEAGAAEVEAVGSTVEEIVNDLCERYGEPFARIARAGSVIVEGERATSERPVGPADEVALLPPVSGGSRIGRPHGVPAPD
jgi:molybdopterin converting factor small subunit